MGKTIDITGQRFGKLTAVEITDKRSGSYTIWKCKCNCGNDIFVASRNLRNNVTHNCGCDKTSKYKDLTGQRFGKLTVEQFAGRNENGSIQWFCYCDCGGSVVTTTNQLDSGNRKSCGCLSKPPLKDWIGEQFGDLTVTAYDGKRNGIHYWKCQCSCGNITIVCQSNLKIGHTKSCGCKNDIRYKKHYVDGTCIENIRKRPIISSNTSGVRGVYYAVKIKKWVAQITFKGKTKNLGVFDTLNEAAIARKRAEDVFDNFLKSYDASVANEARISV